MLLAARALKRSFGTRSILDGVCCALPSGHSLALTGPSGRGKTTLLHLLAGLDRPNAGSVFWDDQDIGIWSRRQCEAWRLANIGLMRQDPGLDPRLSAWDNLLLPTCFRRMVAAEPRAERLLQGLGLEACRQVPAGRLSGGQQVRCALGRALLCRPRLLLADEPTGSLDPHTAASIADALFTFAAEENIALCIASHDQALVARCQEQLDLAPEAPACA